MVEGEARYLRCKNGKKRKPDAKRSRRRGNGMLKNEN